MRKKLLNGMIWACLMVTYGAMAQTDPHNDGLSFGNSELNKSAGRVTDSNAKNAPFYNPNPPQTSNYGAASLFQVGSQRITDCSKYVPTGDKQKDQECSAVNFLAKNPQTRVRIPVAPNDPAIIAGREAMNNATEAGSDPGACITKTTTNPDETAIESCSEYLTAAENQCVMGRVVDTDADSNFQCAQTLKTNYDVTCNKRLVVDVKTGGPQDTVMTEGSPGVNGLGDWDAASQTYTITQKLPPKEVFRDEIYTMQSSLDLVDMSKVTSARIIFVTMPDGDGFSAISVNGKAVWDADYKPSRATLLSGGAPVDPLTLTGPFRPATRCEEVSTGGGDSGSSTTTVCSTYITDANGLADLGWISEDSRGAYATLRSPGTVSVDITSAFKKGMNTIDTITMISGCGHDCGTSAGFSVKIQFGFNQVTTTDSWIDECADFRNKSN